MCDEFVLTFDVDWASESIIRYVIDILLPLNISATFFCTHDSEILKEYDNKFELGIHPDLNDTLEFEEKILELKSIYQNAIGVRAHGLVTSSKIYQIYVKLGLKYDASVFTPECISVGYFKRLRKLICFPYFFEDDDFFAVKRNFDLSEIDLKSNGLRIFNFHPIHIFLNTPSMEYYNSYKKYYQNPKKLYENKYNGRGTETLFLDLLNYIVKNNIKTATLENIYEGVLKGEVNSN